MIQDTIFSVLNQTFINLECIVVDDGSTDNTADVVQSIIKQDSRLKYVYQENGERGKARNNGAKIAIGDFICFLDSDDLFLENHLQNMYNEIYKCDLKSTIYFSNFAFIKSNEIIHSTNVSLNGFEGGIMDYLVNNPLIPGRILIPSKIAKSYHFDEDIVVVEDLCLWFRLAEHFEFKQVYTSTVLYHLHEDNSVNLKNNAAQKRLRGLKFFKKKYPDLIKKIGSTNYRKLLGETYFSLMKFYLIRRDKLNLFKYLIISIFYQGSYKIKHKLFIVINVLLNKEIKEYSNIIN